MIFLKTKNCKTVVRRREELQPLLHKRKGVEGKLFKTIKSFHKTDISVKPARYFDQVIIITMTLTRQSGGLGLALGILNNPADADGNYNFKLVWWLAYDDFDDDDDEDDDDDDDYTD